MAARRVLVIEDEPGARDALGSLLAEEGYTVCTAATGRAGVQQAREFRPDTIVCDFYLPDIDGLQVLRAVRAALRDAVIFIVVTAGCGGADAERTLKEEADFFLPKPLDLTRFRRVLQARAHSDDPINRKEELYGRV